MCNNHQISIQNTSQNPPKLTNIDTNMGDDAFLYIWIYFWWVNVGFLLKSLRQIH